MRRQPLPDDRIGGGTAGIPGAARFDSRVTSPEVQKLIPIRGDGRSLAHTGNYTDPYKYWLEYYRTHDETGDQLRETLRILNISGKPHDIYAALNGFLTHHPKKREAWMYEAAAMALEMIGEPPAKVKTYLGYAADLALRSHNPNDLVSVADKLYLKGYYERIGTLLDDAAARIPHRFEPLVMSINLAQNTRDAARMEKSIDGLLSLGWPGSDDYFRQESRKQAEKLAAALREEGRDKEAAALLDSLPAAEARDLFVRLSWDGDAAYDLIVEEPLGARASLALPRTVFGGALLNDGNVSRPEEVYVCPRGFDGEYKIQVDETYCDAKKPPTQIDLEVITHEGTSRERKQVFSLNRKDLKKPIVVKLDGGRRKSVLPFVNPAATFAPVLEAQLKNAKPRANPKADAPKVIGQRNPTESKPRGTSIKIEP